MNEFNMKRTILCLLLFSFVAFQACEKEDNNNISIVGFVKKYDKDGVLKQDKAGVEVSILNGATTKTNSLGKFNFSGLSSGKYQFKIIDPDDRPLYNVSTFIGSGEGFLLYEIYDKLNYLVLEDLSSFDVDEDYLYCRIANAVKKPGSDSLEYLRNCVVSLYVQSNSTVSNTNYALYRSESFNGEISSVFFGFRISECFDESIDKLYAVYYISNYYEGVYNGIFYNEDFSVGIKSSDQKASEVFEIEIKP